jgi:serine/threonine protein kinase
MDYEDGGNLLDKISPHDTLSYRDKLKVVIDMMNALEFLRIHDIVHRDIKPENILYSKKDGNYKLADFGLAIKAG